MSAWTISGLMVARLAKEHIDPDNARPAGSTSSAHSDMAVEPKQKIYAEPRVTVMGGYQDDTQPTEAAGKTFEPLVSVIEPTPSTETPLSGIRTTLAALGAMYDEMLACDSTSPMSQTGRTLGNFF